MKVAVAVPRLTAEIEHNFAKICDFIEQAGRQGVDLLLFPECVLTALNLSDDYQSDLKLAISFDSEYLFGIREAARRWGIWVALGFLEQEHGVIYDSAVLIDDKGGTSLHYRRIHPGWRLRDALAEQYGDGRELVCASTPWGRIAFLICGDLFHEPQAEAKRLQPDILLFPFARCFSKTAVAGEQQKWDEEEWPNYRARAADVGALTLMANYIAPEELFGGGFGGGFILSRDGKLLASLPLRSEGLLVQEVDSSRWGR